MQPKLFHKLLTALIVASLTSVVLFAVIAHWYSTRSFLRYINDERETRLTALVRELGDLYERDGSWRVLQEDGDAWRRFLREAAGRRRELAAAAAGEPPPPPRRRHFRRRPHLQPTLYDVNHNIVAGQLTYSADMTVKPIRADGALVGYIGVPPLKGPATARDIRFAKRQAHILAMASGVAFVLSLLIAVITARLLARPIMQISSGARALASGHYDTRLPPLGHDEIGGLAEDFNLLARSLQENESARRRWIADISHELRTPLAIMRGEIEAVRDGIRPADERVLHSLGQEIERLTRLIEDLYQLARADIGALDYEFARDSLAAIVGEAVDRFAHRFQEAGLRYELDLDSGLTALVDKRRLLQMLENLFENCCRYVDAPGRVVLSLRREGALAQLNIDDSGPGVDDADRSLLFEPLQRGERSRSRDFGGSGLGLAICKRIAEAHGGTITAAVSPHGGLRVQVSLPVSA